MGWLQRELAELEGPIKSEDLIGETPAQDRWIG
jgi:hypothetical protein